MKQKGRHSKAVEDNAKRFAEEFARIEQKKAKRKLKAASNRH